MSARLTPQEQIWRSMTEAAWQRQVTEIASLNRWRWYHAPENRPVLGRNGRTYVQNVRAGFPDLVLVRSERLAFAELKRETGVLTEGQPQWHEALRATGVEVYVWRPSDIKDVLRILA